MTNPVEGVSHEVGSTSTVNAPALAGTEAVNDQPEATDGSTCVTTSPAPSRTVSRPRRLVPGGGVLTLTCVALPVGVNLNTSTSPPTPMNPLRVPTVTTVAPGVVSAWSSGRNPPRAPIRVRSSSAVLSAFGYWPSDHWVTAREYGVPMIGPQSPWPR